MDLFKRTVYVWFFISEMKTSAKIKRMVGQWGDIEATILREGTVQIGAPYMKMKLKQISLFDYKIHEKCEKFVIGKRRFCERIVSKKRKFFYRYTIL